MQHYEHPPTLLRNVLPDPSMVTRMLEQNAPYTPLGGWYRPDQEQDAATSPLWFQNDWVHESLAVPGSELFLHHEGVIAAAQEFYNAEIVVPHTLYVNLMASMAESGPAHTDNPVFQGRSRANTPMALLRTMFWSGLFERWAIRQATSIWWMNDVEGGGFRYWPDGPDKAPKRLADNMANTALVGDNHGMFHQVEPVGPFDEGTRLVTGRAQLGPLPDRCGDWQVEDRDRVVYRAPLENFRISVLWKAHIYRDEAERRRLESDTLSLADVARVFSEDLAARDADFCFDLESINDPAHQKALTEVYPEATPVEAGRSIFDALM